MIYTHHLPLAKENNPSTVFWQLLGRRSAKLIIAEKSTDYKTVPPAFYYYDVLTLSPEIASGSAGAS